jgi:branched-chain amino acid aminotransferase
MDGNMHDFISLNGQVIPYDEARIAPGDGGFLHGAGLFETMRAKNGVVFRLGDHLDRLKLSAEELDLPLALEEPQLRDLISELLEANELRDARLRLTLSRGDLHVIDAQNPVPPVTLLITASAFTAYPAELYAKGMTVMVSTYRQNPENPLTGHKTTSYLDRLIGLRQAQAAGAGEALWFSAKENELAEGSISNVFIVDKDGVLATPPVALPQKEDLRLCLPGITRKLVLELAREANMLPHERMLRVEDLVGAREVFLTNAIMGVMPVARIERHAVGDEKPGAITTALMAAYNRRLTEECGG